MAFTETLKAVMDAKNLRSVDITSDEITAPYLSRLFKGKGQGANMAESLGDYQFARYDS